MGIWIKDIVEAMSQDVCFLIVAMDRREWGNGYGGEGHCGP